MTDKLTIFIIMLVAVCMGIIGVYLFFTGGGV